MVSEAVPCGLKIKCYIKFWTFMSQMFSISLQGLIICQGWGEGGGCVVQKLLSLLCSVTVKISPNPQPKIHISSIFNVQKLQESMPPKCSSKSQALSVRLTLVRITFNLI